MDRDEPLPVVPAPGHRYGPDTRRPRLHDISGGIPDVEGLLPWDRVFLDGVVDLLFFAEVEIGAEDLPEIGIKTNPGENRPDGPGAVGGNDREGMVLLQGPQGRESDRQRVS